MNTLSCTKNEGQLRDKPRTSVQLFSAQSRMGVEEARDTVQDFLAA